MRTWIKTKWNATIRRSAVAVLALALAGSFIGYETIRPLHASPGAAMSNATPLDDSKIAPLLSLDEAMETVAARVTPAIVNVAVTSKVKAQPVAQQGDDQNDQGDPFGGLQQFFGMPFGQMQPRQPQFEHGIGSGVIISPNGYIVTNNHVVEGATEIRVTMSDRRILTAKLIGTDPLTDLAVIKIDGSNFPNIPMGNSADLKPGQTVLAFGNPFGMRFTVTRGIISALNRSNLYSDDPRKPGEFIQTDAAINPGNSGGPLVDARGEVIGINTFLISPSGSFSGMGFAIPTQIVQPTVDSLIRFGKVSHAYMGIGITDVTPENAKFFDLKDNRGAVITQVEPDSPGAKAGLKVGDVITELNGQKVTDAGQLQMEVSQKQPDTKVTLEVMRDGNGMSVPVTLEAMGSRNGQGSENASGQNGKPRWGVGIADLTPDVRQQIGAPDSVKGAVIQRVQPGSPADDAGLAPGQVIISVDRHQTPDAADVQKALSSVPKGQDALVLVWGNGGSTFRVLHAKQGA